MTTTLATTEYLVTLRYCAEDWDEGVDTEDAEYDTQPLTQREYTVRLPEGSTPFAVYCAVEEMEDLDEIQDELSEMGGSGVDGDGISIEYDGKEYALSSAAIAHNTTWEDFSVYPAN